MTLREWLDTPGHVIGEWHVRVSLPSYAQITNRKGCEVSIHFTTPTGSGAGWVPCGLPFFAICCVRASRTDGRPFHSEELFREELSAGFIEDAEMLADSLTLRLQRICDLVDLMRKEGRP